MRFSIVQSVASISLLGLASCVIQTGPGSSTAPAPAATPAATAAPAAPAATTGAAPTIPTIAPAPSAAPTTAGTAGVDPKKALLRAPEINKGNAFGGAKPAANALKGEVFAIPETSKGLPAFASLQPYATLYTTSWDVAPRKFTEGFPGVAERVEWFAIRWEGKVTAKTPGVHLFKIKSDDGARLVIDGQQIVSNDGLHAPTEAVGPSLLNGGEHTIAIEYFQGPKFDIALQIWVTAPGGQPKILTTSF